KAGTARCTSWPSTRAMVGNAPPSRKVAATPTLQASAAWPTASPVLRIVDRHDEGRAVDRRIGREWRERGSATDGVDDAPVEIGKAARAGDRGIDETAIPRDGDARHHHTLLVLLARRLEEAALREPAHDLPQIVLLGAAVA